MPGVSATRAVVTGLVQGVGYRYWTVRQAHRLGIVGWVRNRPGGAVEVLAQGRPEALEVFVALLAEGPAPAQVAAVDRQPAAADPALTGFQILG